MIGWLVDCLVDCWLIDWLVDWLIGWLLIDWLIDRSDQLINWVIYSLFICLFSYLFLLFLCLFIYKFICLFINYIYLFALNYLAMTKYPFLTSQRKKIYNALQLLEYLNVYLPFWVNIVIENQLIWIILFKLCFANTSDTGIFPPLPPLGPRLESCRGHYVDWVFSPYLTVCVFRGTIL